MFGDGKSCIGEILRSIKKSIYERIRNFKIGDDGNALVKHNLEIK